MNSKTSFFKKALMQKNFTRFWPAGVLYLVILFCICVLPIYMSRREDPFSRAQSILDLFNIAYHPVIIFMFAILVAILHASYLYQARSCNMMHAFPLTRGQLFASNYLTGLLYLIVPQVIIFLLTIPAAAQFISVGAQSIYLLAGILYTFVFFTTAMFCCLLAGHPLSALVYYLIFHSVFVITRGLFVGIQKTYGYGMSSNFMDGFFGARGDCLSPVVYIVEHCRVRYGFSTTVQQSDHMVQDLLKTLRIDHLGALLIYCLAAVGFLILSICLYRKRQLECAGDMSAFKAVNAFIRWVVSICCGLLLAYALTMSVFDRGYTGDSFPKLLVLFILFNLGWYIVAEMVLKKNFRIFKKKTWCEWGVLCVICICLLGAIKADAFHVARHVPRADQVETVEVRGNYTILSKDPATIAQAISLQESCLAHQKEYIEAERAYYEENNADQGNNLLYSSGNPTAMKISENIEKTTFIYLNYYLKNGQKLSRSYCIPLTEAELAQNDSALSILNTLETPESALALSAGLQPDQIHFTSASFTYFDQNADPQEDIASADLDAAKAEALYQALKKDLEAGSIHYRTRDTIGSSWEDGSDHMSINLQGQADGAYQTLYNLFPDNDGPYLESGRNITPVDIMKRNPGTTELWCSFYINSECQNTCDLLQSYGLIKDAAELDQMEAAYQKYYADEPVG